MRKKETRHRNELVCVCVCVCVCVWVGGCILTVYDAEHILL